MKKILHVGCGFANKNNLSPFFSNADWEETRLDIDPNVKPDIICSMTKMELVKTATFDAVYSSHNIEHLYAHDVCLALKEFRRILKNDGFLVITCPDIQQICELVTKDKLLETAYISPIGSIAPFDILFGHRGFLFQGKTFMAHKSGFTEKVLVNTIMGAGFMKVFSMLRKEPFFDIWTLSAVSPIKNDVFLNLHIKYFLCWMRN